MTYGPRPAPLFQMRRNPRGVASAPRLASGCRIRMRGAKLARKLRHLDSGQPCFESFVPALESCAINGLLERVTRQHTKDDWQAAVYLRELQSASGLRTNVIVVRRFAAQNTSDGDQRIVLPRRRQFFRSKRQFERSRNVHDINILVARPGPFQRIHRRCEKPLGNKTVEAAHHNAKAETRRAQAAINLPGLYFFRHCQSAPLPLPILYFLNLIHFPLNCGGLFSKNAVVPSRLSSVAHTRPNSVASRKSPSSWGISIPRSIASMVYFTASGALAMIFFAIASAAGKSPAGS